MTDPDNIPISNSSPPQFASLSNSDINKVRPQFPTNNQHFEPCSSLDPSHSFTRPRISDNEHSIVSVEPPSRMNHPPSNNLTDNIFFKTRLCADFRLRGCRNGENCNYAHGNEELRRPPPNWKELERLQLGGNMDDYSFLHEDTAKLRNDSWKTRESSAITIRTIDNNLEDNKTGTKPPRGTNGETCSYAHGKEELRKPPPNWQELERLQLGGNRDAYSFLPEDAAKFRNSWKTRESSAVTIRTTGNTLEDNKTGTKPPRGTYWKTKICSKWNSRSCPYGDDCNFAHGDAELRVPGRRIEAEAAVAITNSTKAVIPTLPTTGSIANNAPTILPTTVPVAMEEERRIKKELLWKKLNKINRIYGDWIDD